MLEIPSNAFGNNGNKFLPPLTIVSVVSANVTSSAVKISDENLHTTNQSFKKQKGIDTSIRTCEHPHTSHIPQYRDDNDDDAPQQRNKSEFD